MSKPVITETISGYSLIWQAEQLRILANRIRVHNDGRVTGEILIQSPLENTQTIYPSTSLNFTSDQTRTRLIKTLESKDSQRSWHDIINQLSLAITERARQGEPVQEVWITEDSNIEPPKFLLDPIILEGTSSVLFGEKGTTKSTMALLFYICLLLPWEDNPFGLVAPQRSIKALILDWEQERSIIEYYARRFQVGMNLPPFPIYYRRCGLPLVDDIEQIQNHITEVGAEVVIIDSLGAAVGGELSKPEPALNFFSALRRLKVSSLILAQTSKDMESKKKSIYGSVYFTYYARSIFELCKSEAINPENINVALFHRWANYSGLSKPMGFGIHFNDTGIKVERESVNIGEFREKISLSRGILDALKDGAKTPKELTEILDSSYASIGMALKRLERAKQIIKLDKVWGLLNRG